MCIRDRVVDLVREECGKAGVDPVLNLTTSGSKWPEDIRRAHLPILKPEMCSYDPGTMNWANSYISVSYTHLETTVKLEGAQDRKAIHKLALLVAESLTMDS